MSDDAPPRSVRFCAHGRVQGVFFRKSTQMAAEALGVSGWVRNRPDGAVEGEATGSPERIERFLDAVRQGPRGARVDRLDVEETGAHHSGAFDVLR